MSLVKTIGIIVARMSSSRLPGKVLMSVNGRPLLSYHIERLQATPEISEIWLATTTDATDVPLVEWAEGQGIKVFTYDQGIDDVVGRIHGTIEAAGADRAIIVLGDSPFAHPPLLSRMLAALDAHPDWDSVRVHNPDGASVHRGILCFTASGWRQVNTASTEPQYREHPASILRDRPDVATVGYIEDEPLFYDKHIRLTVDTKADLALMNTITKTLETPGELLSLEKIVAFLQAHPDIADMNQHVLQKTIDDRYLKVLFAAQGGGHFGTGHVARCKTLAHSLEEYHAASTTFWIDTPYGHFRRQLADEGYNVIEGNWSLAEAVRQARYDRLVIDFQSPVTPSLIHSIRAANPDLSVVIVDNNGQGCGEADAVVFPNVHAVPSPEWARPELPIYQGRDYILLGAHFLFDTPALPEESPLSLPSVMVSMGGSDPELLTEKVLDALKELKDCHIDLVVPPMYPHPENLEKIATMLPSTITLHWRVDDLRLLMRRATMAVCAFGITSYELAYSGVPTLLLGHYHWQVDDIERFCEAGSAISMGWGRELDPAALYQAVSTLLADAPRRAEMAASGKALVNLEGPKNVAQLIMSTQRAAQPLSPQRPHG